MEDNNEIPADEILSRYGDTINFHLDNIIDPPNDDGEMILIKPSSYYGIDCLPRSLDQIPGQLNILSINAQSLNAKYDELLLLLNIAQSQNIRFHVICILETWLSETSDYSLVAIDGYNLFVCLFVCFITKSFLTYSFVLPTPTLSTICRPLSSYTCSITPETVNVGSSYSHMRGPGVGCWLTDRSNCSHWSFEAAVLPINPNIYTDQWEPIVIYHSITLTGRYTTMQPTLLTSWLQLLSYKV